MFDTTIKEDRSLEKQLLSLFLQALTLLIKNSPNMANEMDKLQEEVAENKTVIASATALLTSLAGRIRENAGNQAKILDIANELDASNKGLAAAVAANTVADEEDGGAGDNGGTGDTGGDNGGGQPAGDVTNDDGSVTHADGTTTHPDGSVTGPDGSVITGPTNG